MPLILTDEYVKKNCMSQYPVPLKALKGLKPNRDKTPNYITKLGRTGIKPIDLPIYSPASVRSLANSISNISKLDSEFARRYLENMITGAERERIEEIMNEPDDDVVMVDDEMGGLQDLQGLLLERGESSFIDEEEIGLETKQDEMEMDAEARAMATEIRSRGDTTIYSPRVPTKDDIEYLGGGGRAEAGRRGGTSGTDTEQTRTAFRRRGEL